MGSSMEWPQGPEFEADLRGWYDEHRQCLSGFPVRELVALAKQDAPAGAVSVGDGHGYQILDRSTAHWIRQLNQCIEAYPRDARGALYKQKLESQCARDALLALRKRVGSASRVPPSSQAGRPDPARQEMPETV